MGSPKTKQLGNQVKHLLFISILIFSSFLTSCEKKEETLYKWETSSGSEWKTMGDENDNLQYKGEVKREYIIFGDYIFDGLGSLTHPDGRKYVGKFKDGKFDGQGTFTLSNGVKYVGKWKDDKRNGQGTFTYSDGVKYVGEWKDDKRNGQGIFTYSDGGKYVGEFKDGKKHGQGTDTSPDGTKSVGEFKEGRKWNVTQTDKEGKVIGKWVNGVKQ